MNINVTVDDLDAIDLTTVINRGDGQYGEPGEQTLADLVVDALIKKLTRDRDYPDLAEKIRGIRAEVIREQIEPLITAAVQAPLQRTDTFGHPTGKPTTLAAMVIDEAHKLLANPADQYNRRGETVMQKLVREEIGRAFTNELSAALADEKAKVVAAVRAKAADLIATAVKDGIGR